MFGQDRAPVCGHLQPLGPRLNPRLDEARIKIAVYGAPMTGRKNQRPRRKTVFIVRSLDLNPRLQTGRGFSRFFVSVYELHKRESHGFSPSVSHRLDHEVSLQGAGRRVAGAERLSGRSAKNWASRSFWRFVARTCPYVRGIPAAYRGQRLRTARQGTLVPSGANGVP